MTTWNNRIVKYEDGTYGLHECYWEDDKMVSRTERAMIVGDTPQEIREQLIVIRRDAMRDPVDDIPTTVSDKGEK